MTKYYVFFCNDINAWAFTSDAPADPMPIYFLHPLAAYNCARRMNVNEGRTWAL